MVFQRIVVEHHEVSMAEVNEVLLWHKEHYRVIAEVEGKYFLYPMNGNGITLKILSEAEMRTEEDKGLIVHSADPYIDLDYEVKKAARTRAGSRSLVKMKANYTLIKPIIDLGPMLLTNERERAHLLSTMAHNDPSLRRKLSRLLSTYWKKGQKISALLPDYGKNTAPRNCRMKVGPKFSKSNLNPPPLNNEIRELFHRYVVEQMQGPVSMTMRRTYTNLIDEYLLHHPEDTVETAPSYNQFRYYYYRYGRHLQHQAV